MREAFSQTGWMTFTVLVPEQKRAGICLVGGVRAKSVVESTSQAIFAFAVMALGFSLLVGLLVYGPDL